MAVDKLVDSTQLNADLTSVADAIRTKGGTIGSLAFPAGFVSAVQAIPTGTTPTGTKQISITENGTTTEDVAAYANAEITVNVQGGLGDDTLAKKLNNTLISYENSDLTSIPHSGFLRMGSAFKTLSLPNVVSAGQDAFRYNYITAFNLPKLQTAGQSLFYQSFSVEQITLPALVTANVQNLFAYCDNLLAVDIGPNLTGMLGTFTFYNSSKLITIILRSNTQINLNHVNAFNNTPFASNGSGGTLYVPQALIADYQAATNWSTILGYSSNQILPIEGSIYETQYADGTPIT